MKFLLVVLIFFVLSALLIISNNNLTMCKQDSVKEFFELYIEWIDQIYANTQVLTGDIVKLDWFPSNIYKVQLIDNIIKW